MTIRKLILGLLAFLTMAGTASAAVSRHSFTINAFDSDYGSYSGTVSAPGSFFWNSGGGDWIGDIDLTEGGLVIAHIFSAEDDYTLFTADATIGAPCAANACIAVTDGETVSLYSTINSLNGGQGICCDYNGMTPLITVNSVPEPATWSLLILGFGGLGVVLRSRRAAMPAAARGLA